MSDVLLAEVTLKIKKPWHIKQLWMSVKPGFSFVVYFRSFFCPHLVTLTTYCKTKNAI